MYHAVHHSLFDNAGFFKKAFDRVCRLRAVSEPQTAIAVKGPREGFIEDIKTNMGLVRRRLKTPALRFRTLTMGKLSGTAVCIAWLEGTADAGIVKEIE